MWCCLRCKDAGGTIVCKVVRLSLSVPFPSKTFKEMLRKNLRCSVQFHKDKWAGRSEDSKDLVKKMLARYPKHRITFEDIY